MNNDELIKAAMNEYIKAMIHIFELELKGPDWIWFEAICDGVKALVKIDKALNAEATAEIYEKYLPDQASKDMHDYLCNVGQEIAGCFPDLISIRMSYYPGKPF